HRHRNGPIIVGAHARPERRAGGRAQRRLPRRRRQRAHPDRHEGPPRVAGRDRSGQREKGAEGDDDPLAPIRKAAQGFGNVTKATVGTIQRQLLVLENQGGTKFFGEPALTLKDFMRTDRDGRGMINILVADKLMQSPRLYATFLLWMMSELFEEL